MNWSFGDWWFNTKMNVCKIKIIQFYHVMRMEPINPWSNQNHLHNECKFSHNDSYIAGGSPKVWFQIHRAN